MSALLSRYKCIKIDLGNYSFSFIEAGAAEALMKSFEIMDELEAWPADVSTFPITMVDTIRRQNL